MAKQKRDSEPKGGQSRMEILAPVQAECVQIVKSATEDLRDILDSVSTQEKRATDFLISVYNWKASLAERSDELRELALKYKDARPLIYRYVALFEDAQTALTQLRYAMRSGASQWEVDAQCSILRTIYIRLADMIAGSIFVSEYRHGTEGETLIKLEE